MIYSDKLYLTGNGQKIYVFSTVIHGGLTHGIGADLNSWDVISFVHYDMEITSLADLDPDETRRLGTLKKIRCRMSKSLAIIGKARAGKGTLLNHLMSDRITGGISQKRLRTTFIKGKCKKSVRHIDLADPIRACVENIYGPSVKKDRDKLILIGQGLRAEDEFIWAKSWLRRAIHQCPVDVVFAVTDIRQPSDLSFFNGLGFTTVKVVADETKRTEVIERVDGADTLHLMKDETESFVVEMTADFKVFNDYSDFKDLDVQAPEALLNIFSVKE
ncbi:hypothetical protein BACPU_26290 [Bacillus pumilus]|nr:hypothetical protein BACPU_26290 [Bacillus pumilus]